MDMLRRDAVFPGNEQIITIDGLRVEYADGFGLARASNTTPVIVMRFEAETPAVLASVAADAWLAADAGGAAGLLASVAAEACTWAPDCANAAPASRVAATARIAFVIIFPFHYVKVG
ncbi:Phosphomannomutase/phosphoglucomutase [Janthinobacterium sp. AD80]|nr:Phosphomannomutase/phosphoglucomutase [Janthinobacterium sp. AD80]